MDLGITGRVALVLNAGGGLGSAIAVALAREGATVIGCGSNAGRLELTAQRVSDAGGTMTPLVADLTDVGALDDLVSSAKQHAGPISILVNMTGGPPPSATAGVAVSSWQRHFESMVLPVFRLTDLVLPDMREQRWGRVITSTSSGVIAPIPNLGISNTLRSTLVGWSKSLSAEIGRDGITANVVLPGRIATGRIVSLDSAKAEREGRRVEDVAAESMGKIPVGRYGDPAEYGDVIAFLASERASYITGSVVRVDGGMIPSI
ncbi:MAG: 3-oxoacyl-(acyl-carrier protein) reductase [Microbacteriaceae bacterium]|nr:3-oxoacyl-(acyl-carrier protein) reductase [Microbacteriaceae bacterium]